MLAGGVYKPRRQNLGVFLTPSPFVCRHFFKNYYLKTIFFLQKPLQILHGKYIYG